MEMAMSRFAQKEKSLGRKGNPFGFARKFTSSTGLLFQFDQNM
jgi:hypothetical protein